jgi:hypothetical protein
MSRRRLPRQCFAPAVALPSPTSPLVCLLTTGSALFCIGIT